MTDRADLIAKAETWLLAPTLSAHEGFLLVTDMHHALAQSERERADAQLVIATWRHDDADEFDQLRQKLSQQAAVIDQLRAEVRLKVEAIRELVHERESPDYQAICGSWTCRAPECKPKAS